MASSRAMAVVLFVSSCITVASACGSDDDSKARGEAGAAGEHSRGGDASGEGGSAPDGNSEGGSGALGGSGDGGSTVGGSGDGGNTVGGKSAEGGAGGSVAEAGAGGAIEPCSGPPRCLSDEVAASCSEAGELLTLQCTNGCAEGACLQTVLSGWLLHHYDLSDDTTDITAAYSFSADGLSALQTQNSQPSIYYLDQELENVVIRGSFGVETGSDDDLIGFVFGLQDTEHFYLFDWKQTAQPDANCGDAALGASLKLVSAGASIELCRDFWSSSDTTNTKILVPAAMNPTGWLDNTVYEFELRHAPGQISIRVTLGEDTIVDISSSDATYGRGRFGFYNYSQEQSRYQFFDIQPGG